MAALLSDSHTMLTLSNFDNDRIGSETRTIQTTLFRLVLSVKLVHRELGSWPYFLEGKFYAMIEVRASP